MRSRALLFLALALWPALAGAAPGVEEIVDKSVDALENTCYEARMRFLSQFDDGNEEVVRIHHCVPDLYRVEPLDKNNQTYGVVYVENNQHIIRQADGRFEELPERRFNLNDTLTIKFLDDLAKHPGTMVLDGMVGSYPVYILRQEKIRAKPYTVTVGIDKRNFFPLLLLVNDGNDRRRVYFEMEAIEYRKPAEMAKGLFSISGPSAEPRPAPSAPQKISADVMLESNSSGSQVLVHREGSMIPDSCDLPLIPTWLPDGYSVQSIGVLDYFPGVDSPGPRVQGARDAASSAKIVFRIEARGDSWDRMISIVQTKADTQPYDFGDREFVSGDGFFLKQVGDWLIAVIGGPQLEQKELQKIVSNLKEKDEYAAELIRQTKQIDRIMRQAAGSGD